MGTALKTFHPRPSSHTPATSPARSSALYREDLAAQLKWYYNTSDPEQVSPTGTPYGFTARPLRGRTPGFPVLLEAGLSAGRAAAMVRYLADGNYLDHRQTLDLTAELLVRVRKGNFRVVICVQFLLPGRRVVSVPGSRAGVGVLASKYITNCTKVFN